MYRNLKKKTVLKEIMKNAKKKSDIVAMCIWGSFDDEVPGIHLGHLHMMNKLCDLAMEEIQVCICINEEPDLQNVVKRHTGATASILRVLASHVTGVDINITVLIGSKETEKLCKADPKKFEKLQQKLYRAHKEILNLFAPLTAKKGVVKKNSKLTQNVRKEASQKLGLGKADFDDLFELLVIRNKVHARTSWASQFGATLQLMKKKPAFLIIGERHKYIWTLYNCMFRLAGQAPIPIICVTDFMDCIGKEPMNSRRHENNIRLDEESDIMKRKFLKVSNVTGAKTSFALWEVFEKLLFTRDRTVTFNKHKYSNYQELMAAADNQIARIAEVAVKSLKQRYRPLVRIISEILLADSPRTDDIIVVDNLHILTYISEDQPIAAEVLKLDKSINQTPQSHMDIYNQVLDKVIIGTILDPYSINAQMMNNQYLKAAFDNIKLLILSTRDMDFLPYQISKRHRDHYYHQINVGGLGAMLLDLYVSSEMPLWKYMAQSIKLDDNDEINERKIKAIWWITALLHDHAYELEYAIPYIPNLIAQKKCAALPHSIGVIFSEYLQMLRSMMAGDLEKKVFSYLFKGQKEKACKELGQLVGGWLGSIKELVPNGLQVDDIRRMAGNHGVIGAINFLCKIAVDDLDDEWKNIFVSIAAAILVHHLPNTPKVSFIENPLSFLLILVDEIQEWSRLLLHLGEFKSCLDKIELSPFLSCSEHTSDRKFGDYLEVVFPFSDEKILTETGWNRDRFNQDKRKALGRLVPPRSDEDFNFPRVIKWLDSYPPYEVGLGL